MGSGKSALADILSTNNDVPYLETDSMIENEEGMSISTIFKEKGESYFRMLENQMIRNLGNYKEQIIISTGGGLPCHDSNMEYLNSKFFTVYLKVSASNLVFRLRNKKEHRPIIANKDDKELSRFIKDKLIERENFYNQSKMIVELDNRDKNLNASYLEKILRREGLL